MKIAVRVSAIAALVLFILFLFLGAFYPEQETVILTTFLACGVFFSFAGYFGITVPLSNFLKATYFPTPEQKMSHPVGAQPKKARNQTEKSAVMKWAVPLSGFLSFGLFAILMLMPAFFMEHRPLMFVIILTCCLSFVFGFYFGLIVPFVNFIRGNFPPR